jgi:hypothetical protein
VVHQPVVPGAVGPLLKRVRHGPGRLPAQGKRELHQPRGGALLARLPHEVGRHKGRAAQAPVRIHQELPCLL